MIKIFILFPLLVTTIVFSSYEEELILKATEYHFEQDFKNAYKYSVEALVYYPEHPYAYLYIGNYFSSIGKFHTAMGYYDKAINYHYSSVFSEAYWERAFSKIVVNKDLSYCEDIHVIEEHFTIDDTYKYLEEKHEIIWGLCKLSSSSPKILIDSANILAGKDLCFYSLLFYNEASKNGTSEELANYNNSLCKQKD